MNKVHSSDGTAMAFDRLGDGPPVVLVCGASTDLMRRKLIPALYNLHRRGRRPPGTYCRPLTAHRLIMLSAAAPSGFLMQRRILARSRPCTKTSIPCFLFVQTALLHKKSVRHQPPSRYPGASGANRREIA